MTTRALEDLRAALTGRRVEMRALAGALDDDPLWQPAFFESVLPRMLEATLSLARSGATLPRFTQGVSGTFAISRAEAAGWVAAMLLGLLADEAESFPSMNAAALLSRDAPSDRAKLRCILALFDRAVSDRGSAALEIRRNVVPARDDGGWSADDSPLTSLEVDAQGLLEEAHDHLQVDFAHPLLGGGVLRGGCFQEEIRFSISPELFVAMATSPALGPGEAIAVKGVTQVARYRGFGTSFRYVGPCDDRPPSASTVVAIDALDLRAAPRASQYERDAMLREMNKARAGFAATSDRLPVATGNWGGGAFGGDIALKAVLQWLAASACGRPVRYHSFGEAAVEGLERLARDLRERQVSVGRLWRATQTAVVEAPQADDGYTPLFERIDRSL